MSIYGKFEGLTHDDYTAIPAINRGGLALFQRSPAHYRYHRDNPEDKETPSKIFGRLAHMAVLEPERWAHEVVVSRKFGRTKDELAAKEKFEEEHEGKIIVAQDLYYQIEALRKAALKSDLLCAALMEGEAEVSVVWQDPATRVNCKARFDLVTADAVFDLKTTADCSEFPKTFWGYGYHLQAAWYMRGARAVGMCPLSFRFVAIEKEAPFAVRHFHLSPLALEIATKKIDELLLSYARCLEKDNWPSYPDEIELLELPAWMAKDLTTINLEEKNGSTTATN